MELTLEQIQDFKGKYPRQIWSLFSLKCGNVSVSTECAECLCFYDFSTQFRDEKPIFNMELLKLLYMLLLLWEDFLQIKSLVLENLYFGEVY